jgi:hypothetical protein
LQVPSDPLINQILDHTMGANSLVWEGAGTPDWRAHGRMGLRNNVPASGLNLTRINPWLVIGRADGNPPSDDVMVKFGNLQLLALPTATMAWAQLAAELRPDGAIYDADFVDPVVSAAPIYSTDTSLVISQVTESNRALHFYVDRVAYSDLAGILVVVEAKLISKTGAAIPEGQYLIQMGCDFKTEDGSVIRDAFVGSMRPIGTSLRRFYGSTMTYAELAANYPPENVWQMTQTDAGGVDPDYEP